MHNTDTCFGMVAGLLGELICRIEKDSQFVIFQGLCCQMRTERKDNAQEICYVRPQRFVFSCFALSDCLCIFKQQQTFLGPFFSMDTLFHMI